MTERTRRIKPLTPSTRATAPSSLTGSRINEHIQQQAKPNYTNTDYTFKLYNKAHPNELMVHSKEPKFSDFYQPNAQQKQSELLFVGAGGLALGYAAFRFI